MGIAFITAKAEPFQHQRDAAFEEQMGSGDLFSRLPETVEATYRCKSCRNTLPEIGTPILLHQVQGQIKVYHNNKHIGSVMPLDYEDVVKLMTGSGWKALPGCVCELQPMSGIFLVRLQPPKP